MSNQTDISIPHQLPLFISPKSLLQLLGSVHLILKTGEGRRGGGGGERGLEDVSGPGYYFSLTTWSCLFIGIYYNT